MAAGREDAAADPAPLLVAPDVLPPHDRLKLVLMLMALTFVASLPAKSSVQFGQAEVKCVCIFLS